MALDELFVDNTIAKILDHFIAHEGYDYTKNEVAKCTKLSRITVYRNWDILEKAEIIKPTRQIGRAQLYTLNKENEVIKKLLDFALAHAYLMAKKQAEKELSEELVKKKGKAEMEGSA
jgi:Fe2+ or Zn2+ uptake regulation protein